MRASLIILMIVVAGSSFSKGDSLSKKLVAQSLDKYSIDLPEKRRFISLKKKSTLTKINPVTYVAGSLLFVYQRVVSEQIQANCNYELSCSSFTKYSMEQTGMLSGLLIGLDQLMNCFPGASSDYEACRINSEGKVINHTE